MKAFIHSFFFFFSSCLLFAQTSELSVLKIADSLKTNANAVVRFEQMDLDVTSQRSMSIKQKRVVTVLNEKGLSAVHAREGYDKTINVKNIGAIIYDALGNEIKKIKRKDFKDQISFDGVSFFSDDRVLFLDYTPTQYPFTIIYESEISSSNTAFLPRWYFLSEYNTSVEKSVLNVRFPTELGFKKKEFNFSGFNIKKNLDTPTQLSYTATNILAQKEESLNKGVTYIFPWIMMGIDQFNLSGVDGQAKTWQEFGQWYFDKILSDTFEISDETKTKMKALVANETDPLEKARKIYNYVQQKSRYVGIQVGIGSWKPMLAKDVDRLGYGDCKALTNYTHVLLKSVGVNSFHTLLYGSSRIQDIESDMVTPQGNHMMLAVPYNNDYYWLECTSQDVPFGYQANFTDARNVLVIKPEGGEIVKTKIYQNQDNGQVSKGSYKLEQDGSVRGSISITSSGVQYDSKYLLDQKPPVEREEHYKNYWSYIQNLKIQNLAFEHDKKNALFTEKVEVFADNYATISSDRILFVANVFNPIDFNIKRFRNRKTAFEISRGSYDVDEIQIELPKGYKTEVLPKDALYNSKFGDYKAEFIQKDASNITYKRTLLIKKGQYSNAEYEEFRLFMEQIARQDQAKIVIIKS